MDGKEDFILFQRVGWIIIPRAKGGRGGIIEETPVRWWRWSILEYLVGTI